MRLKYFFVVTFLLITCIYAKEPKVKLGIEVLESKNFKPLIGKRVGLVTNASGVDSKLNSTVDILFNAPEVNLVALYGPEHGIRGNIEGGDIIEFYIDPITDLPVYSLYGKTNKPTKEMLEAVDVLVYDIQDIGCRSYTFISTMGLMMEAAAENNKEVIILDRPNPLGGERVEGCYIEEEFKSLISQFKIPYVYGLTCGELAIYLNEKGLLPEGVKCNLTVIPMEGWQRKMTFEDTGLCWVPTSPHIPHKDSPYYYVASGIVGELRDAVSIGVGYTFPFQSFATEWIDGNNLSEKMSEFNLAGVLFRPVYYKPYYAFATGKNLLGIQIHITDYYEVELMKIQFYFLEAIHNLYPDKDVFQIAKSNQVRAFDRAIGTDKIRKEFIKNYKVSDIEDMLSNDAMEFKNSSREYYLYD